MEDRYAGRERRREGRKEEEKERGKEGRRKAELTLVGKQGNTLRFVP